jgi:hypothetical protein
MNVGRTNLIIKRIGLKPPTCQVLAYPGINAGAPEAIALMIMEVLG